MLLTSRELEGLFNTEAGKFHSFLVFLGLLEEELGSFLVETGYSLRRQVRILGHSEGTKERVDQVLVRFIEELVHDEWHAGGWVLDLAHHGNKLADNYGAINLALHVAKFVFEDLDGGVLHREVTKAPII